MNLVASFRAQCHGDNEHLTLLLVTLTLNILSKSSLREYRNPEPEVLPAFCPVPSPSYPLALVKRQALVSEQEKRTQEHQKG